MFGGRKEKEGLSIKEEIEKLGSKCIYVKADLENLNDCKKIISETDKKFKTIVNINGKEINIKKDKTFLLLLLVLLYLFK